MSSPAAQEPGVNRSSPDTDTNREFQRRTVKVTVLENGFLVTRGDNGKKLFSEHLTKESGKFSSVLTLLHAYFEEVTPEVYRG